MTKVRNSTLINKPKNILISSLLSFLITISLLQTNFWLMLDRKSFDLATTLFPAKVTQTDIIIIGIDDASFAELETPWPWPREWHRQLLKQLKQAGAKLVFFDLIFDTPSTFGDNDDVAFAEEIMHSSSKLPIILGSYQQHQQLTEGYQVTTISPLSLFHQAGAISANVNVDPDSDGVLRALPSADRSVWQQALAHIMPSVKLPHQGSKRDKKLVHLVGGAHSFPYVSYARALTPGLLPQHLFKDKIVLIGLDILAPAELGLAADDRFLTAYSLADASHMAGIEFHANAIENARSKLTISSISSNVMILVVMLLTFFSALIFQQWHALTSTLMLVTCIIIVTTLHWALFNNQLFIPLFSLLLCLLLSYLTQAALAYHQEQKDRKFISKAFTQYVSPHILQELLQQPEKLTLGGTRKSVTIMFTDLAGFTKISEQLTPEQVAELLQQHLSTMSDIIIAHGGTIDKYIGDAIMAFWGAPLPDDNQADNALKAAIAMQSACDEMQQQFFEQQLPKVTMRIGIHSGVAIVGNMGSDSLFDYTCIGDTVNVAARLESLNKYYHSEIMISENCKKQLRQGHNLQFIDCVCVQGKSQAINIYSPCENETLPQITEQAFNAYQQQNWLLATKLFNDVIKLKPKNNAAEVILQRIDKFKQSAPSNDWDGSHQLTKK